MAQKRGKGGHLCPFRTNFLEQRWWFETPVTIHLQRGPESPPPDVLAPVHTLTYVSLGNFNKSHDGRRRRRLSDESHLGPGDPDSPQV